MMNNSEQYYKKWNTIIGWLIGLTASVTYIVTAEAAGSFWDCGEFVSCAYKIQNAHPPGNTLFGLFGRFFILLFGDNPMTAAYAVNILSAVSGGFAIMFLFWVITHFTKKLVQKNYPQKEWVSFHSYLIFSAGIIGSASAIFTDSFWFSTVEGEVYALAACFLLAMVWLMVKWENRADTPGADKYIVFIFLLVGLSTGVHLLDLLVIPVLSMMYYFKRFNDKIKISGIIIAFLSGCLITGLVMTFVIGKTISWGAYFDLFFVNTLGLPIFSGFIFFIFLLILISIVVIIYARRKGKYFLRLGMWCYLMMLLGYSVYNISIIRAKAVVPINMANPDNPMALNSYVSRAQYGDKPLLYGQVFTAGGKAVGRESEAYQPTYRDGKTYYAKMKEADGKEKYIQADKEFIEDFNPADMMLFPRVWNNKNDGRNTQDFYANWLGISKVKDRQNGQELYERPPTFSDNIRWFLTYQIGWMYMRYLMWNFVGRQNDIQGLGNVRDGNVITGIDAVDNIFLGDQSKLPASIREHKSRNTMFALPFILGLLGLIFHYKKDKNGFITTFVFFFFTGLAIMLYLNDAGPQPRERDYASAVSFLVFCLWIGLSSVWVFDILSGIKKIKLKPALGVLFALIFLLSPVLMALQEWDDHDRGKKTLARDYAKNVLSSCDSNAILFTSGDNDTYPLWYVQEVEGFRTDVRVVNTSLLGIDWYIYQLTYNENKSNAFDIIFKDGQLTGNRRNFVFIHNHPDVQENDRYELYDVIKNFVAKEDKKLQLPLQDGSYVNYFPIRKFFINVDKEKAIQNHFATADDNILPRLDFEFPKEKRIIRKDELAILCILATDNWERPLHFLNPYNELGFGQYFQKQGMTYKLVPFLPTRENVVNFSVSVPLLLSYESGGLEKYPVYVDETNRMQLLSMRDTYTDVINALTDKGDMKTAQKLIAKADAIMPDEHFPYGLVSRYNMHNTTSVRFLEAVLRAEDTVHYRKIASFLRKDIEEQRVYYQSLPVEKVESLYYERERAENIYKFLEHLDKVYKVEK